MYRPLPNARQVESWERVPHFLALMHHNRFVCFRRQALSFRQKSYCINFIFHIPKHPLPLLRRTITISTIEGESQIQEIVFDIFLLCGLNNSPSTLRKK